MTESKFTVEGITCNNCVTKLTKLFDAESEIEQVIVDKERGALLLKGPRKIDAQFVQETLKPFPKYRLVDSLVNDDSEYSFRPLIVVIGFIILTVILTQVNNGSFDWMQSMRFFMGGFFMSFSFFKLLDLDGFAEAYQSYDIVAGRWKMWAYIYPFVELVLGISYVINFQPIATNIATLLVMGVSSIGVIKAVMSKTKIKCACLGTGFNLPMTTVTIIEDLGMVLMAVMMLLSLF